MREPYGKPFSQNQISLLLATRFPSTCAQTIITRRFIGGSLVPVWLEISPNLLLRRRRARTSTSLYENVPPVYILCSTHKRSNEHLPASV